MSVDKIIENIEKVLGIKCIHHAVKSEICNFCPDCGKKIATRWTIIKCKECEQLRKAQKAGFATIFPHLRINIDVPMR